jgi:polysaccharide deacetylase family protein (PEP-CTERM system associated)
MKRILSFDLEDWYQLLHRVVTGEVVPARDTLVRQTERILETLDLHQTHATFFVLGMAAEHFPELIKRVASAGHEIAVHGYAHLTAYKVTRAQFREDTRRAKAMLEDMCGERVFGYRATAFSITQRSLWALEELEELGFTYDSSIFPVRHRRYGIPDFPAAPARYLLPNGGSIAEIPLATVNVLGASMPVAGGGYFRLLPYPILRSAVERHEKEGRPFMTYFHPYEFDSENLDVFRFSKPRSIKEKLFGYRMNWHQNLGRRTMIEKLDSILADFEFSTAQEYLNGARLPENTELLSSSRPRL